MKLRLSNQSEDLVLEGYSDANWAENREDRKSNSGSVLMFCGGTVSWACRKQSCVSLSTCEAEYIALAETCQETIWLRRLCKDLGCEQYQPTKIKEDNQSCLKLIENQKFSNRTKHIDTKYHFVRDISAKNLVKFEYCASQDNVADVMTKPLGSIKMQQMRLLLGIEDIRRGGVLV